MPTDLETVFVRARQARVESDNHRTLILICFGICLVVLVLLFLDHGFAEAVELMGEIEF
jgi:hypothetical protein